MNLMDLKKIHHVLILLCGYIILYEYKGIFPSNPIPFFGHCDYSS